VRIQIRSWRWTCWAGAMLLGSYGLTARADEPASSGDTRPAAVEESALDIVARMRAAVDDAVAVHPAGLVLMIGHGIAILNYLADLLRLSPGSLLLYPPFTGVSIVRVRDARRAVGTLFDVSHLEAQ